MGYEDVRNFLNSRHAEVDKLVTSAEKSGASSMRTSGGYMTVSQAQAGSAAMQPMYSYQAIRYAYSEAQKKLKPDNCDQTLRELIDYLQTRSDVQAAHYQTEFGKISAYMSLSARP